MSRRDDHRARAHERLEAMLPWYVNDTLDERGRAEVEAHLQQCDTCREEALLHQRIAEHVRLGRQVHPAPLASLGRLMDRIEAHEASHARRWQRKLGKWVMGKGLERAVIAQAVTIVLLVLTVAWLVTRPEPAAEYRTLGAPAETRAPAGSQLRLQLQDTVTAAQVERLLHEVGGRIVYGPSPRGVYIIALGVSAAGGERSPAEIAAWLGTQPGVLRATVDVDPEPR